MNVRIIKKRLFEPEIGEEFEFLGVRIRCIKKTNFCRRCDIGKLHACSQFACTPGDRQDGLFCAFETVK